MSRSILLISYDFAPEISGVRRVAKMLRWLPDHGWTPSLLTTTPFFATGFDLEPLGQAEKQGLEIIRVESPDPFHRAHRLDEADLEDARSDNSGDDSFDMDRFAAKDPGARQDQRPAWKRRLARLARRWYYLPDERRGWVTPATQAAAEWLEDHPGAPFLTTSFPHSCHLIGLRLNLRFRGRHPWIADFRDGWTQNADFFDSPTRWHERWHRRNEAAVARKCTLLTTASPPITQHLHNAGNRAEGTSLTILNGFDAADIERAREDAKLLKSSESWPRDSFTIVYTGTLFGRRQVSPLLQGIERLLDRDASWRRKLKLLLFSKLRREDREEINRRGLSGVVETRPFLPHRHALAAQAAADALCLLIAPGPRSGIMMTQKVFEYLGAARPILAIVPPGACRDLLRRFPHVAFASPENDGSIASAVEKLTELQPLGQPPPDLTRRAQIEKFAGALEGLRG